MNILYLSQLVGYSTPNSFRTKELALYLSKYYDIDIIGSRRTLLDEELKSNDKISYHSGFNFLNYAFIIKIIIELLKNVSDIFIYIYVYKDIRMYFKNAIYTILIKDLLRSKHYDFIIVSVLPWANYALIPLLAKHSSVIVDVSDPLYKNAFHDKKMKGNKYKRKTEGYALSLAMKVVVMSEPLIGLYHKEMFLSIEKLVFIPPACCLQNRHVTKTYSFIGDELKFVYAGSLYKGYREADNLIAAIGTNPRWHLDIVSNVVLSNFSNIDNHPWMSQKELENIYLSSDVLVFIDNFFGYQIPSKIYELLTFDRPILFIYDERNTYLYEKLKNENGVYFAVNNIREICNAINRMRQFKIIKIKRKINFSLYSKGYMCSQFYQVLKSIN